MASKKRVLVVSSKGYKNFNDNIYEIDFKDLLDCENYSLEKTVFEQMGNKLSSLVQNVSESLFVIIRNCEVLFNDWNEFITSSDGLNNYKLEDTRVLSYGIEFLENISKNDKLNLLLDSKVECKDKRISDVYQHIYLD